MANERSEQTRASRHSPTLSPRTTLTFSSWRMFLASTLRTPQGLRSVCPGSTPRKCSRVLREGELGSTALGGWGRRSAASVHGPRAGGTRMSFQLSKRALERLVVPKIRMDCEASTKTRGESVCKSLGPCVRGDGTSVSARLHAELDTRFACARVGWGNGPGG